MLSLLAVLCPPLAVLAIGSRSEAIANLGWTLLFFIPGVVNALAVVDRYATARRYESVMRAMEHAAA